MVSQVMYGIECCNVNNDTLFRSPVATLMSLGFMPIVGVYRKCTKWHFLPFFAIEKVVFRCTHRLLPQLQNNFWMFCK